MIAHSATRDRITRAADQLIYERGYDAASFADFAGVVGISRGNFYHHFKAKDDLLEAVLTRRLEERRQMLERWESENESPVDRLRCFVGMLSTNHDRIRRFGCPLGTLSAELAKQAHPLSEQGRDLFDLFRAWFARQFEQLGRIEDADRLALQLLSMSQGAATLTNIYPDEQIMDFEIGRMLNWLDAEVGSGAKDGIMEAK